MAINTWGETLNSWDALISTVLATITIQGIPNGPHLITLYNDTTDALVFDGVLTFTSTVATVQLAGNGSTIYTGTWLGDNPPTTGAGLYGTASSINGIANGFNGEPPVADVTAPVITVSGSAVTTITQFGAEPSFTASTDDGSTVFMTGSINASVVGSYVLYFNSTDTAGNVATQVTRTVNVQATVAPGIIQTGYQTVINERLARDEIWQHSDNFWFIEATDDVGNVLDPLSFTSAQYLIFDGTGRIRLSAELGVDIAVQGTGFLIRVSDQILTFTGQFRHQFVLVDSFGNKRPPEFYRRLRVNPVTLQ
jgi:hypothetical protein